MRKTATIETVNGNLPCLTISAQRPDGANMVEHLQIEVGLEKFLAEAAAVLGQAWANHTGDAVIVQVANYPACTIGVEVADD